MKKLLFLLPLLALSSLGISGCKSDRKARITYGTLVDEGVTELLYSALKNKVANNENMLVAVWQDSGLPCGCWTTFKSVLEEYVKTYKTKIYTIARSQFSDGDDTFGLTILNDTTAPTFALIKNGKKTNEFIYSNDNKPMFTKLDSLRTAITKIARDPQYMLVDQTYLDNALFTEKKDKVIIHYIWSFCPDCLYCFPNVMVPYSENNQFDTKVWIIDLGVKGILLDENNNFIGTGIETYVSFLKEHKMSAAGDERFGYDRGFVPTTQIWEKGRLVDATTFFNDTIELKDDKYIVTKSFYSEERIKNINYVANSLEGKEIPEADVVKTLNKNTGDYDYSWDQDKAAIYHKPFLESFLEKDAK